jgi:hypothetical protein
MPDAETGCVCHDIAHRAWSDRNPLLPAPASSVAARTGYYRGAVRFSSALGRRVLCAARPRRLRGRRATRPLLLRPLLAARSLQFPKKFAKLHNL